MTATNARSSSQQHSTRPRLHVECCLQQTSACRISTLRDSIQRFLRERAAPLVVGVPITDVTTDAFLAKHVQSLAIDDGTEGTSGASHYAVDVDLDLHVYQLNDDEPMDEMADQLGGGEERTVLFQQWALPARSLHGLWESLVYDDKVKERLMRYIATAMQFSRLSVDPNLISWNRVVLLHGPPGTGKTSLCRALAHRLAIRLSEQYTHGTLVELNSHSLFSKWFSESGKLVAQAFDRINELAEETDAFVCILIDEVESLTTARKAAMSGAEPSDAIRVVNAVLTQLDRLRRLPNVLLLTTSNITGAIDVAFVDRADIKQYIGPPSPRAVYSILHSCLQELMRVQLISPVTTSLLQWSEVQQLGDNTDNAHADSVALYEIAKRAQGLSGRVLRKLPFLACARRIDIHDLSAKTFLRALAEAIEQELDDRKLFTSI